MRAGISVAASAALIVFLLQPCDSAAADPVTMGAVRSSLYQVSAAEFAKIEIAVQNGPFRTLRNRLATSLTVAAIERDARLNAERMAALQARGIDNFLVPLQTAAADYDSANPYRNPGICNMPRGALPLSEVNLGKYRARLAANLREMKRHGVRVVAFELGNEINTACFNGDVPVRERSMPPSEEEFNHVVRAYAAVIKAAVETVHRPEFYPQAKIVSAGIAGPRATKYNGHNIPHPGRIIRALKDVPYEGASGKRTVFDLLDGIGIHYYARNRPQSIEGVRLALADLERDVQSEGKPYWMTEWFPGRRIGGEDLYGQFKRFYEAATHASVPLAAMYVINIGHARRPGYDLVDANYQYFPDIRFFREVIPPIVSITADRAAFSDKKPGAITWRSHNVPPNSCSVQFRDRNNGDAGVLARGADSGTEVVGPLSAPRIFTLTCESYRGGRASAQVAVP